MYLQWDRRRERIPVLRASGDTPIYIYDVVMMQHYLIGSELFPRWFYQTRNCGPYAFKFHDSACIEETYKLWLQNELLNSFLLLYGGHRDEPVEVDFKSQTSSLQKSGKKAFVKKIQMLNHFSKLNLFFLLFLVKINHI